MLTIVLSFACAAPVASEGELWQGFRGPNGSGVNPAATIPEQLNPETTLSWNVALNRGYSSPVVAEFEVLLTAHEGNRLFTVALERDSGEVRWTAEAPKQNDSEYKGPNSPVSSTPATDGEAVYVLYPCYGLVAYDMEGTVLWQKEMAAFNVPHIMSSSPQLADELVILQCDQDTGSFLIAIDKKTGATKWKTDRPGVTHSYSSPVLFTGAGHEPQVVVSGAFQLVGYSLETGEKLWWVDGMSWQSNTLPVVAGDTVYVHSFIPRLSEFGAPDITESFAKALEEKDANGDGKISREEWPHEMMQQLWFLYDLDNDDLLDENDWNNALQRGNSKGGLFAVQLGKRGNLTDEAVAWTYTDRRGMPDFSSPLFYDGILYTIKDGGLLTAIDPKSGDTLKQARVGEPDKYYASLVAADGRLIAASHSGQLTVVEAGPDWQPGETYTLDQELWSTPAVAGSQVFVRTQEALFCFEAETTH